jgi:hypothetical protein
MNRTLSNLAPALLMAAAILAASAVLVAAPGALWAAISGPLVLVLALLGSNLLLRRQDGRRLVPSSSALLLAVAIPVACFLVASRGFAQLASMMPIFGAAAALPVITRNRVACATASRA